MEIRTADWTFAFVLPVTEPEVAETVAEPRARAVASPLAVIDATLLLDDAQVTEPVISFMLPSENVPVAVNCCRVPRSSPVSEGVTAIDTRRKDDGDAPTPGPKLPEPQALNRKHTKTAGARYCGTEVFGVGALRIAEVLRFVGVRDEDAPAAIGLRPGLTWLLWREKNLFSGSGTAQSGRCCRRVSGWSTHPRFLRTHGGYGVLAPPGKTDNCASGRISESSYWGRSGPK